MTQAAKAPSQTRTETDSIGPIEVPFDAFWGAPHGAELDDAERSPSIADPLLKKKCRPRWSGLSASRRRPPP